MILKLEGRRPLRPRQKQPKIPVAQRAPLQSEKQIITTEDQNQMILKLEGRRPLLPRQKQPMIPVAQRAALQSEKQIITTDDQNQAILKLERRRPLRPRIKIKTIFWLINANLAKLPSDCYKTLLTLILFLRKHVLIYV